MLLPLSSPDATLENSGGKGASLARLTRLGLPVPSGFILTTQAYRDFVSANRLQELIAAELARLSAADSDQPARLETASQRIRPLFSIHSLSPEFKSQLTRAYLDLDPDRLGVAVRSSATAEDLPELSFAGQQDTYLNVLGQEQLFQAVVDCWSSLWTARAIGYRLRNLIPQADIALAVVVQRMLASRVSGVLFTADPLSGLRTRAVIDATFGLGEALVSGRVEPDHYVVDARSGELLEVSLGAKAIAAQGLPGGGIQTVQRQSAGEQTLTHEQVRRLVALGREIETAYGSPQDIEWALVDNELSILQARPITSLFPVPRLSFDPLEVWFSFGAVQGVVGPFTPLGQEAIQRVVLGMGKKFHLDLHYETQQLFVTAGERIWIKVSDMIRNPLGWRIMSGFMGYVEPSVKTILEKLVEESDLPVGKGRLKFSTLLRLLGFFLPLLPQLLRTMLAPQKARQRFDAGLEKYLGTVHIPGGADRFARLASFADYLGSQGGVADALPTLLPGFLPIMAPAMASLNIVSHLLPPDPGREYGFSNAALEVTRGLPHNVTTEMDLVLWQTARTIHSDGEALKAFQSETAASLAGVFLEGALPQAAQSALAAFLERYGMRGVAEIDLGRPAWDEDPAPVIESLQSYLQIPPESAPDRLFQQGARAAEAAVERLAAQIRRQPGGRIREKIFRAAVRRVRILLGARESPKFFAVRAMGVARTTLLSIGREFTLAGTIERPDDLFFLHVNELTALSAGEDRDWKGLIASRREAYARETRRRQVPRLLVSDGRAFYEGVGVASDSARSLSGSPVSPGTVEGCVRVVFDPRSARLAPGEILVCPGTDPAWTPLFMAAGGLVMEVGGMMTHGSVVAREYGIPAVVGVHQATHRLKDGQRIRLDGSTGLIEILE